MSNPLIIGKDLANITIPVCAAAYNLATAGGAGNNVLVVGTTIDRKSLTPNGLAGAIAGVMPTGAIFEVVYEAALGATYTFSITRARLEDSVDGTNWNTIFDTNGGEVPADWPAMGVFDTGGGGGTTQRGVVAFGTDVKKCREYVRFSYTPSLSNTATDTVKSMVAAVLSGIDEVPPGVV